MSEYMLVADIVVGERSRKDYGDLTDLMESIKAHDLLQPIGLAPDNRLLFGGRRLEAVKRLGWEKVAVTRPATQTDALNLLRAERDENTCRKDMTTEELVDLGLRLEELERPEAEERKRAGGERGRQSRYEGDDAGSVSPETQPAARRLRDGRVNVAVGEALDMSPTKYFRAKSVVQAARGEKGPEVQPVAQAALADLNAGKLRVNGAYDRLRPTRQPEAAGPTLVIPQPPKMGGNRRKHLQVLEAMSNSWDAHHIICGEIEEFDSSVTPADARSLSRAVAIAIKDLNRFSRMLKDRADGARVEDHHHQAQGAS